MGWGIPFPAFSAPLSVYTELVGGALLVLGLCTRLAAVPLLVNMVVAIFAVSIRNVGGLDEFVSSTPRSTPSSSCGSSSRGRDG